MPSYMGDGLKDEEYKGRYLVRFQAREMGAIGIFGWDSRIVVADSAEKAKRKVFDRLHEKGYETAGGECTSLTCRECAGRLMPDPAGSLCVMVHVMEEGEPDWDKDREHAPVPDERA